MLKLERNSLLYNNRDITCCFSGHRDINATPLMMRALADRIYAAYACGYRNFCTGGARGFDMLAAEVVTALKQDKLRDIRSVLLLPYPGHQETWSGEQKEACDYILRQADEIIYTSSFYYEGCMQTRDRALVDVSSRCIAYLTEYQSGTAYTVAYAQKNGLEVYDIAENILSRQK